MASGRAADREDPKKSKRKAARSLVRDPISELHQGQRSDAPHQRAGHMTAPDHSPKLNSRSFAGGDRPHMIFATAVMGNRPKVVGGCFSHFATVQLGPVSASDSRAVLS
jgi:hypothetical protein